MANYTNIQIPGLVRDATVFVGGKRDADGGIDYEGDGKDDLVGLRADKRYHNPNNPKLPQGLLQLAHELKAQHPIASLNKNAPDYREKLIAYENAIIAGITSALHAQTHFGDYNTDVSRALANGTYAKGAPIASLHGHSDGSPTHLTEFKTNELICSPDAGLVNALAYEAGMNTVRAGGYMDSFAEVNQQELVINDHTHGINGHMFVVSLDSCRVIEATRKGHSAIQTTLNNLTAEEILAGKTIITLSHDGMISAYGVGQEGARSTQLIQDRLDILRMGDTSQMRTYKANNTDNLHNDAATQTSQKLADEHYKKVLLPHYNAFAAAIENCDLQAAIDCHKRLPLPRNIMSNALTKLIEDQDKSTDSASTQERLKLARFCIEHGATECFKNPDEVKKKLPFFVDLKTTRFNREFTAGLVEALQLTPRQYLAEAGNHAWPQHIKLALENLPEDFMQTPDHVKLIQKAEQVLKNRNHHEGADLVSAYMAKHTVQSGEPIAAQPSWLMVVVGALAGGLMTMLTGGGIMAGLTMICTGAAAGFALATYQHKKDLELAALQPAPTSGNTPTVAAAHTKTPDFGKMLETAPAHASPTDTISVTDHALANANAIADKHGVAAGTYQPVTAPAAKTTSITLS